MDKTIAVLRARIEQLRAERLSILPTAIPLDRAIGRARVWIAQLTATVNAEHMCRAFAGGHQPNIEVVLGASDAERQLLAFGLWLDGDRAVKRIERDIRAFYESNAFLTDDPGARPSEIDAEVFQLEVKEERRIGELAADGVLIARRSDASPEAVLAAAVDEDASVMAVEPSVAIDVDVQTT